MCLQVRCAQQQFLLSVSLLRFQIYFQGLRIFRRHLCFALNRGHTDVQPLIVECFPAGLPLLVLLVIFLPSCSLAGHYPANRHSNTAVQYPFLLSRPKPPETRSLPGYSEKVSAFIDLVGLLLFLRLVGLCFSSVCRHREPCHE